MSGFWILFIGLYEDVLGVVAGGGALVFECADEDAQGVVVRVLFNGCADGGEGGLCWWGFGVFDAVDPPLAFIDFFGELVFGYVQACHGVSEFCSEF